MPDDISAGKALGIMAFVACLGMILASLDVGVAIDDYLARKAEFAMRSALRKNPPLHQNLKLFIYDDQTVSMVQAGDIELSDWAAVFEALAAAKPKHIIVDKLFDLPKGLPQAEAFNERMAKISVPIITGGFVTSTAIPSRQELALDKSWNNLLSLTQDPLIDEPSAYPTLSTSHLFAYGPHPKIADAFTHVGHIVYGGAGRVSPLLRLDTTTVMPHMGLLTASSVTIEHNQLQVNGKHVVLHNDQVQVNLSDPAEYASRSFSMKALIARARSGGKISVVHEGDEVLLLPAMFTGSTDWFTTPAGQLPGGYLVAGMINSVLTGVWLTEIDANIPLILLASIGGLITGLFLWGQRFWFAACLITTCMFASGLACFAYFNLIVSWLYPSLSFLFTALTIFAERSRMSRIQQVKMDRELETAGLVQRALFPKYDHTQGQLKVLGHFQSADKCGGDWWWHFSPSPGIEYVIIGDAMGHGVPAALVTGLMYSGVNTLIELWDSLAEGGHSPARILQMLNKILFSALEGEVTMTMFVGCFDTRAGNLSYANAGHRFPIFLPSDRGESRGFERSKMTSRRGNVAATMLTAAGNMLGIAEESSFQERSVDLRPGDRFVLYTDGVLEKPRRRPPSLGPKGLYGARHGTLHRHAPEHGFWFSQHSAVARRCSRPNRRLHSRSGRSPGDLASHAGTCPARPTRLIAAAGE